MISWKIAVDESELFYEKYDIFLQLILQIWVIIFLWNNLVLFTSNVIITHYKKKNFY